MNTKVISFSATSTLTTQTANRQGSYQRIPQSYTQWQFRPNITAWGVPLGAELFLTTQQNASRQNMNSFALNVDLEKLKRELQQRAQKKIQALQEIQDLETLKETGLADVTALKQKIKLPEMRSSMNELHTLEQKEESGQDSLSTEDKKRLQELQALKKQYQQQRNELATAMANKKQLQSLDSLKAAHRDYTRFTDTDFDNMKADLSDKNKLAEHLENFGLLSGGEGFMNAFESLGLGVNYPRWSGLTLQGVSLNGLEVEWAPGHVYAALAGGRLQKALADTGVLRKRYERMLYAGRLGYGAKQGAHVYLTGLYGKDEDNSAVTDTITKPQENYVLGLELRLPLLESLHLEAEAAASVLTEDINSPILPDPDVPELVPGFLVDLVQPRTRTHYDYAYSSKVVYNSGPTQVRALAKKIRPGFATHGVPYLRTDYRRFEGGVRHALLANALRLDARFRLDEDNLLGEWKSRTTITQSYRIGIGLTLPRLPYFRASIAPYNMQTEARDTLPALDYSNTAINVSAGYNYTIGSLRGNTTLRYNSNENKSALDTNSVRSIATSVGFAQSLSFAFPLSLNADIALNRQETEKETIESTNIRLNATYSVLEHSRISCGLVFNDARNTERRLGLVMKARIPAWYFGRLELNVQKTVYDNMRTPNREPSTQDDYDELIFRAVLHSSW